MYVRRDECKKSQINEYEGTNQKCKAIVIL